MANYKLSFSGQFKKDFKKYKKQPRELKAIAEVLELLEQGTDAIPQTMKPHKLIGNYKGNWECHIFPDLLLIWEQEEEPKEITLIRLGSHSDLFR
jgi:mRNA interferase YafQ